MSQANSTTLFWFQNDANDPLPVWIAQPPYVVVTVPHGTFPILENGLIVVDCDQMQFTTLANVCSRYLLPVLALVYASDVSAALEIGAWDYFIKGEFTPKELDRVVRFADNHQHTETRLNALSRALLSAEMRYINLIQKNPDGIVVVGDNGVIEYVNPAAEKLFNRSRERLTGNSLGFPIISGEMTEMEIVRGTGHPMVVEMRVADTEWNNLPAQFVTLRDITDRREAEGQIRYQANLIENVSDAIISVDVDRVIRSWNRGAEVMYGWQQAEVIGQSAADVLQTEFVGTNREGSLVFLNTEGYWRGEVTQTRKDGNRINVLASTTLINDDHGTRMGIVSINQDITKSKRLEEEIFQARVRQAELEKERELIDLKANFISMVSHEFRTPLSVIVSTTEVLQRYRARLSELEQDTRLERIQERALHMAHLLDEVLLVSQASTGKIVVNPAPLHVEALCRRLMEEIQIAQNGTHQFIFEYQVPVETVNLDEKLMEHILINLLSNAVKYSPGQKEVQFSVNTEDDWLVFWVKDHGIGIPESARPRLFQPFFRANNTKHIHGTGLGLVIVKNMVEAHGGTIEVESEEGIGTTFIVRLPMH